MSARRVFEAHMAVLAGSVVVGIVCGLVAIWTQSERLGGTAGLFGGVATVAAFAAIAWVDGAPKPTPRRSRATRRRLREEKERIELDAEIRRMEREAGL